jgi:hypothetical protein
MTANHAKAKLYTEADHIAESWQSRAHQYAIDQSTAGIHGMTAISRALLPALVFRKLALTSQKDANDYLVRITAELTGA